MPGTDGGRVGISNTARPSRCSSSVHTPCGSAMPSTAGNAARSSTPSCPITWRGDFGPERGVVEGAREAERVDVGAPLGHEVELHAARLYAAARERVRGQRRVEVLERAKADDADRGIAPQVAAGHRLRHDRGRARRPDRGRQQEVLLEAARVGVGRKRACRDAGLEPVDRRGHAAGRRRARRDGRAGHRPGRRSLRRAGRPARARSRAHRSCPALRCVAPTPLASTSTRAPSSASRTAAVSPARPVPTTMTSWWLTLRPLPEPRRRRAGARRRALPGRSSRRGGPGAADRRRGSAKRPSSAPAGSRAAMRDASAPSRRPTPCRIPVAL